MVATERIQIAFDAHRRISINCKMFQSGQNECGACLMKITSITTVLILTFAGIAGLPWPGTEGFVLSCSAQSMVKDFEQSHLIPPKMQTKLEISRQAELFPSSGFFQPRKVVLFCAIVRVAAE